MAEQSGIAWTDSTFNPWIGCTEVSPGCDNCYARALDARHRYGGATHWGNGTPRFRTSEKNWQSPLKWNERAKESGERHLVFCASLADVFDNEVPEQWRKDLFSLIWRTPSLTWLLLTKRIGNAAKMVPWAYRESAWPNVWLGASIVNQEEADRDLPKLLATPAAKRFVSYEPALGPVDWRGWLKISTTGKRDLHWVIVGGESSQGGVMARPFHLSWARDTVRQCKHAGVACFVKQLGSNVSNDGTAVLSRNMDESWPRNRTGADPSEWPVDLRVQEFPA